MESSMTVHAPIPVRFFVCAFCGDVAGGTPEYTIHRDGFGEGPEVPLCRRCGGTDAISCSEIWARIAKPVAPRSLGSA
jgi:hypothetical protein